MNILVDGRAFVKTSAGISTFLQGALMAWAKYKPTDKFYLALPKTIDSSVGNLEFPRNVKWIVSNNKIFNLLPNLVWLSMIMPFLCIKYKIEIYFSPVPCIPFFLKRKIKKIIVVHDVVNIEYKDTMEWSNKLATGLFFNRSVKMADIIWTNSFYTKACVEKYFPDRKCMDIFVGCSVNRNIYRKLNMEDHKKDKIKCAHGIKGKFILFVGSLEPRKNLSFLVSVMPEIWKRYKVQLVIVGGKGWKNTGISEIINNSDFPKDAVIFCGYISNEELACLYNMAVCFVSASLNEGFGMPQLEAFLCGCPVITANNSAMSEVAMNKKGARLVDGYDENLWIETIGEFISHPKETNVDEFKNYDWNEIIKKVTKIIDYL